MKEQAGDIDRHFSQIHIVTYLSATVHHSNLNLVFDLPIPAFYAKQGLTTAFHAMIPKIR